MKTKAKTMTSKARAAAKPVAKAAAKPVKKTPAKKAPVRTIAKPVKKSAVKLAVKPAVKPIAKKTTPVTKAAVASKKPTSKTILKTPSKKMTKTAPKASTKTTQKTTLGLPAASTASTQSINEGAQMTQSNQTVEDAGASQPITGRGVFAVRTMGAAVSVEAAFLAEDGNVLRLPAVFPNRQYALEQIDELRALVIRHFEELDQANVSS